MAVVRIENVVKHYGLVEAVRGVSLECADGEMMALLGPSGCGKTTMLKMLAGIEDVTSGEIYFDDEPIADRDPSARNIAMVFEDYALYPRLNVEQNIAFPLKVRHMPKREIKPRVEKALDMLDLQQFRRDNVQRLSGGAQQRVSIGRALVRDPSLILFDEPLSHLDGDQKVQLRVEIKRLQHEMGLTSILVTHDQTEAIAMCNRVAVMNEGELQQVDPAEVVYDYPANLFVATFVGEPPMNLLPAELRQERDGLVAVGEGWSVELADRQAARARQATNRAEVILGIRPEHLDLAPLAGEGANGDDVRGTVFFREPRGDSQIILTTTEAVPGEGSVVIETDSASSLREEEAVALRIQPEHVHLFDPTTGENLFARGS